VVDATSTAGAGQLRLVNTSAISYHLIHTDSASCTSDLRSCQQAGHHRSTQEMGDEVHCTPGVLHHSRMELDFFKLTLSKMGTQAHLKIPYRCTPHSCMNWIFKLDFLSSFLMPCDQAPLMSIRHDLHCAKSDHQIQRGTDVIPPMILPSQQHRFA
jgi:hypothetical protein